MAAFELDQVNDQQLDWMILRDGGIALYWRPEILAKDVNWLKSREYLIYSFEAAEWKSEEGMHEALQTVLSFPDYYGRNLNALDECMWDDLYIPEIGGLVLVLNHYDRFVRGMRGDNPIGENSGDAVLGIFARAIRYHSLAGKRLLVLVQSDDAKIQFGRLGCISAGWNWSERLNKDRGL